MELIQQLHAVASGRLPDGGQHSAAELIGAGSGNEHGGRIVAGGGAVLRHHLRRHSGVGVDEIAVFFLITADGGLCGLFRAEAAPELVRQLCLDIAGHLIAPGSGEGVHIIPHLGVVLAGEVEQQPLQIAGDQNVHRGADGGMERPVPIVNAGTEEIRQHIVAVGRADQLAYRQAHALGIIRCQNVAKVTGGDAEVHLVTHGNGVIPNQIAVSGDVVDHLRQNTAPVDGIGGGQEESPPVQLRPDGFIGEDPLHAGLGIVKVADDRPDVHILSLLGHHLLLLYGGHAVLGIVDLNPGLWHVGKALHGRLAGIAGGGHQNAGRPLLAGFPQGCGQQLGQHLQCHVLECGGGTVPQLQTIGAVLHLSDRSRRGIVKLLRAVGVMAEGQQLFLRVIRQVQSHDPGRPLGILHGDQAFQKMPVDLGDLFRRQQAAVPAQAHFHGFRCGQGYALVPCAVILHIGILLQGTK